MTPFKIILGVVVAVLIATGAYAGYRALTTTSTPAPGSPTGSTFGDAKIAAVNMAWTGGAASSTSILNTDGSGRWYYGGFASCTTLGAASTSVASFIVQAATTSVANTGLQGNTNYLMNLNVGTTSVISAFSNNSTTTKSDTVSQGYWPAGTYLTFLVNAVSTTSNCTVGIAYIPS